MDPMSINLLLDRMVDGANRIYFKGEKLDPYHMMHLAGKIMSLALIAGFALFSGEPRMWRFYILFIPLAYLYQVLYVDRIKPLLFKSNNQSFLQDTILFLLPLTCLLIWLLRIPFGHGLDLFGLILPLMLGFRRIGCFLGGCCFGLPSRIGVLYPEHVREDFPEDRKQNPLLIPPATRVFPIQLVESLFSLALFAGLAARLWVTRDFSGLTMLLFVWIYSTYRFISDFFRVSSVRPRYLNGKFSEAQVASLILIFVCSALYFAIVQS